jgi:hypothetical protein
VRFNKDLILLNYLTMLFSTSLPIMFIGSFLAMYSVNSIGETQSGADKAVNSNDKLQTVPYITFRNKTGSEKASDYFGGGRSTAHAGYCELSNTSLSLLKPVADNVPFYIPEDIVILDAIRQTGLDMLWDDVKDSSHGRTPTLYIHGFNEGIPPSQRSNLKQAGKNYWRLQSTMDE